ncbi:hypothetical protein HAX54_034044, partial [Datura stramonium]|nr:hypothetical protein [Datura stramonium]
FWNICEEVGVNDSRNKVNHMDALPCARHKDISATAGATRQHHARYATREAPKGVRRPAPLRMGRHDTGISSALAGAQQHTPPATRRATWRQDTALTRATRQ